MAILVDFLLILRFYKDYAVVERVRPFLELKHGKNGAGRPEIPKIRHLGPKRHHFGAPKFLLKITQGTTQNNTVLDKLK